ncbi:uncharacterized protein LOC112198619 isoform X2 [Rosa chinensis]|uniref:uncharacterized protein LOC112198619 isoform X2 n=1 Tax=Rosa chinensis TaxID=74649 RepID=UPI001AD8B7BD|nr:uncharacterized protein LOC112198619 isoform X2 [Rosa chinensis]
MWKSVANWFASYLYFSKATLCIRGLVFSHSFVNHLVVSALMAYVQDSIKKDSFAAVATNIINGVSSIMVCFLACISNAVGPFKGLIIFWVFDEPILVCGAALLVALGEAGRPASLGRFLEYQYSRETDDFKSPEKQNNPEAEKDHTLTRKEEDDPFRKEEKEDDKRKCALWNHPWFLGAAVTLGFIKRSDGTQLLLSTIAMGVGYSLFWYGVFSYSRNSPAAEATHRDQGLFQAIKTLSPPKKGGWRLGFSQRSESRKHYYKEMLVMCLAFIAYGLVEATGSTFFFTQITLVLDNGEIPAVTYFVILQSLSSSIISFFWSLLAPNRSKRATLFRIGCGLVCSVLCMVVAWRVAIHMSKPGNIYLSLVWFIPQFCLLGCMRGLAIDGLIVFFADRVDGNDKRQARYYGTYASELVLGSGTLLIAASIFGFRGILDKVDQYYKYYRALAFIGGANLCYYFCVAFYFYTKEDNVQSYTSNEDKYQQNVSSGGAGSEENMEAVKLSCECCNNCF